MDHPVIALLLLPLPLLLAPALLLLACHRQSCKSDLAQQALALLLTIMLLNIALPMALHLLGLPINRLVQHVALALLSLITLPIAALRMWRNPMAFVPTPVDRKLLLAALILVPLLLPWGPLAGIDTYKWQDLASAIAVGERAPWLTHPLGFLGLAPRSYPTAFPLLLTSLQLPAQGAITPGYPITSLLVGLTALFSAFHLGRRLFPSPHHAWLLAVVYALSPVVMRYTHWATGRGLFLALYPLMVATALTPTWRRLPLLLGQGLLLLLCHKVAFVAVPLTLLGATLQLRPAPRATTRRDTCILGVLAIMFLAAVAALMPSMFQLTAIPRLALTRYHWLLPLALIGFLMRPATAASPRWNALLPTLLLAPILAFDPIMYGALIATLPIAAFATTGLIWLTEQLRRPYITRMALTLSLTGAIVTVAHRAHHGASRELRALAADIDQQASSPIVLHGAHRRHVQAYVLAAPGCWPPTTMTSTGFANPFRAGLTHAQRIHQLRWLVRADATVEWIPPDAQHVWISDAGTPSPPDGMQPLATHGTLTAYARPTP